MGATVRRPARPWTPAVRVLLDRLRAAGVSQAPAWRGVDDQGRDVFDFLPGDVGSYPLSAAIRSDAALITAARLLRSLHDASVPLTRESSLPWQLVPLEPVEVICHGDFAPYNCVFRGQEAVGVIDFDFARPGPRRWDLAYAIYRFAPLTAPGNADGFGDPPAQARRARLFLDSYGCTARERRDALETIGPRLRWLVDHMRDAAAGGNRRFAAHIEAGHADTYLRDIAYVDAHFARGLELPGGQIAEAKDEQGWSHVVAADRGA
ncbi:MAG TPA: phosphotransferase [Actinomycetes bacterium]|nr:phosphotransferase [Actinomycetes bacterium]